MKHEVFTHADDCACPGCRQVRAARLIRLRLNLTTIFAVAIASWAFILIPGRAAVALAARAIGF